MESNKHLKAVGVVKDTPRSHYGGNYPIAPASIVIKEGGGLFYYVRMNS